MTDYCENVLKVFVPEELAHLADDVVEAMRPGNENEGKGALTFQRLLPVPDDLRDTPAVRTGTVAASQGRWPRIEAWTGDGDAPTDPDEVRRAWRSVSPRHAADLDATIRNMERWGVPSALEWQQARWGTKWNTVDVEEPSRAKVDELEQYGTLDDYAGCDMLTWRYTTANTPPLGWLSAMAEFCRENGLGMMAWFNPSDDGTRFNPVTDETESVWHEIDDVRVAPEEIPATIRLELGGGLNARPDAKASERVAERDPMHVLFEL